MRPRALRDLDQLCDKDLFAALAEGMRHTLHNAEEYYTDSNHMAARGRGPSFGVLRSIAEEEAAKCLILLDAVRCPRQGDRLPKHLSRFYDHLTRGIYALLTLGQPPTFADLRQSVDDERRELFLDGPDGDNYIYRNRILECREFRMYVDYVEVEAHHEWSVPRHNDSSSPLTLINVPPPALQLARALSQAGLTTPVGLQAIATKWRPISMTDTFSASRLKQLNSETCKAVASQTCVPTIQADVTNFVIDRWQYPMYEFELGSVRVSQVEVETRHDKSYLHEYNRDAF